MSSLFTVLACALTLGAACGESTDPMGTATTGTEASSDTTDSGTTAADEDTTADADTGDGDGDGDGDGGESETTGPDSPYGIVGGMLYEDLNANGTRDDGEPPVKSHRIFIDINDDGLWQDDEPYDVTDENGRYLFEMLNPGIFRIYLEPYKDIQTQPANITEVVEDFSGEELDSMIWGYSGDGISLVDGALQIVRNSMDDVLSISPQFAGSLEISMKIRWDSQNEPDNFNGVRVVAPCEEGSTFKAGAEVGRERYGGNWQVRIYNCTSDYPNSQYIEQLANLGTDYQLRFFMREGSMGLMVDDTLIWDVAAGRPGPYSLTFPGRWDDFATAGAGAVSIIDDLTVRSFERLPNDLSVYAGDVIMDADFGRVTIED